MNTYVHTCMHIHVHMEHDKEACVGTVCEFESKSKGCYLEERAAADSGGILGCHVTSVYSKAGLA